MTQNQKDALNQEIKRVHGNLGGYKKIHSSTQHGFDLNTFHQNCANHEITIMLCKTNFGKIIGAYSPMKWRKYNATTITGG